MGYRAQHKLPVAKVRRSAAVTAHDDCIPIPMCGHGGGSTFPFVSGTHLVDHILRDHSGQEITEQQAGRLERNGICLQCAEGKSARSRNVRTRALVGGDRVHLRTYRTLHNHKSRVCQKGIRDSAFLLIRDW